MVGRMRRVVTGVLAGAAIVGAAGCESEIANRDAVIAKNASTPLWELHSSATPIKADNAILSETNLRGYINTRKTPISLSEYVNLLTPDAQRDIKRFLVNKIARASSPTAKRYFESLAQGYPLSIKDYLNLLPADNTLVNKGILNQKDLRDLKEYKQYIIPEKVRELERIIVANEFPRVKP